MMEEKCEEVWEEVQGVGGGAQKVGRGPGGVGGSIDFRSIFDRFSIDFR